MIVCVEAANDTAHCLGKASEIECLTVVGKETTKLHNLVGDDYVCSAATDIVIGISGSCKAALVVDCGLDGELVSCLKLILPLCAYLDDLTAELVTENDGVLCNVIGNSLVACTLKCCLVGGHANAVGNNASEDLALVDCGELELLCAKVVNAVKSDCSCFHTAKYSLLVFIE